VSSSCDNILIFKTHIVREQNHQNINKNKLEHKFKTSNLSSMNIRSIKRRRLKVVNRKYKNSSGIGLRKGYNIGRYYIV